MPELAGRGPLKNRRHEPRSSKAIRRSPSFEVSPFPKRDVYAFTKPWSTCDMYAKCTSVSGVSPKLLRLIIALLLSTPGVARIRRTEATRPFRARFGELTLHRAAATSWLSAPCADESVRVASLLQRVVGT